MNLFTDKYFDTVYDKLPPKDQLFKKRPKFLRDRFGRLHRLQWHDRNGAPVAPGDKNAVDVTVAANPKNSGDPQGGGDASDPRREQQQNGGGDNAQLSYEEFRQDQQEDRPSNVAHPWLSIPLAASATYSHFRFTRTSVHITDSN